ncbi:MAG TPA: hypothetical protein VFB60_23985 [Ktedonobacteraceae bacterium]|nr:hypothetical protein [Ktedonobacteraceae bacterium]
MYVVHVVLALGSHLDVRELELVAYAVWEAANPTLAVVSFFMYYQGKENQILNACIIF